MKRINNEGQYFTNPLYADLLVRSICKKKVKSVVELTAGNGDLITSALDKWGGALKIWANDIDQSCTKQLEIKFPQATVTQRDALTNLYRNSSPINNFDIAIGNPPFISTSNPYNFKVLPYTKTQSIDAELIVLDKYLQLVAKGGYIGIILPARIISGSRYEPLRDFLIKKLTIVKVIELPLSAFHSAEVQTYILILKNQPSYSEYVELAKSSHLGDLTNHLHINIHKAIKRMDFSFYSYNFKDTDKTLASFGPVITRGRNTAKHFRERNIKHFHTDTFSMHKNGYIHANDHTVYDNCEMAEPGDILLSRVGRRCMGRVGIVKSGVLPITDCIFKIRVPKSDLSIVWKYFKSLQKTDVLSAISKGSCAKFITKEDLLNLQIN